MKFYFCIDEASIFLFSETAAGPRGRRYSALAGDAAGLIVAAGVSVANHGKSPVSSSLLSSGVTQK